MPGSRAWPPPRRPGAGGRHAGIDLRPVLRPASSTGPSSPATWTSSPPWPTSSRRPSTRRDRARSRATPSRGSTRATTSAGCCSTRRLLRLAAATGPAPRQLRVPARRAARECPPRICADGDPAATSTAPPSSASSQRPPRYPEMAAEVERALARHGRAPFGVECLRPVRYGLEIGGPVRAPALLRDLRRAAGGGRDLSRGDPLPRAPGAPGGGARRVARRRARSQVRLRILLTNRSLDAAGGLRALPRRAGDAPAGARALAHRLQPPPGPGGRGPARGHHPGGGRPRRHRRAARPDPRPAPSRGDDRHAPLPARPGLFVCHGWQPWEESPPRFPRFLRYVAVDFTTRERLVSEGGIPPERVEVVLNFVDLDRFRPRPPLPPRPRRALVFSNQASERTFLPAVREACARFGIALEVAGVAAGIPLERPEERSPATTSSSPRRARRWRRWRSARRWCSATRPAPGRW